MTFHDSIIRSHYTLGQNFLCREDISLGNP
jgi:hypothetical protein